MMKRIAYRSFSPTWLALAAALLLATLTVPHPISAQQDLDPKMKQVAFMVSRFLQEEHFAKHPIDEAVSREWIENYMETLDYSHLYFLHSDYDEFIQQYGNALGDMTTKKQDISPAFIIFERFRERFDSRVAWVQERLDQPFIFTDSETYSTDRQEAQWPENMAEADKLWQRRLKYELLQNQFAEDSEADGELPEIEAKNFKLTEDVIKTVRDRHLRRAKYIKETDSEDIVETYLSALASVYDPHSQYLSQKSYEDFFISMNQKLFGIGAVLSTEDGYCTIKEIIKGGPADISDELHVNDKITGVAQGNGELSDIVDMKLRDAVRLIRGKKGTVVRLEIIPASQNASTRKEISIVRDEIKLSQQKAQAKLIEQPLEDGNTIKLGIIKLPSFYGDIGARKTSFFGKPERGTSTTDDVAVLLEKLKEKNIDGLVLDLRNNGGGLLDEAIRLAGLFIDSGPVVQIKNSKGHRKVFEDETPGSLYDGPLIVLTNKLSASASEIVAGALQNYSRAVVIGDSSTHGKGTVQTVTEVGRFLAPLGTQSPDVGAVKLTIQKFYLPNGHSTQKRGVIPDIKLPSPNEYLEIGEGTLPHALPWDQIAPAEFTKVNEDLDDIVAQLSIESQHRIAASEAFKNLNDDIANLRERLEHKQVSLNAGTRISEILEDQNRRKKLDALVDVFEESSPDILTIEFDEKLDIVEKVETYDASKKTAAKDQKNPDGEDTTIRDYARDLHLKETLNILKDLILIEKGAVHAVAHNRTAVQSL